MVWLAEATMPVTCTELKMMWVFSCTLGCGGAGAGQGLKGRGSGPPIDAMSSSGCWRIDIHGEAVLGYPANDELAMPLARGEALTELPGPPP